MVMVMMVVMMVVMMMGARTEREPELRLLDHWLTVAIRPRDPLGWRLGRLEYGESVWDRLQKLGV